eukprot:6468207-Amphidinium_carterae.1
MSGLFLAALRHASATKEQGVKLALAVDSGAAASVIPLTAVQGYPVTHDNATGRCYESATGEKIIDEGL